MKRKRHTPEQIIRKLREAANCMRLFETVGEGITLIAVHPIVVLPNFKAIAHIAQGLDVCRPTRVPLYLAP